ncbi:hypothetical protein K1719_039683 [Acacia pycnantha]|nr:hypothetical protein K1719_039683 [Acacia pycnantha]
MSLPHSSPLQSLRHPQRPSPHFQVVPLRTSNSVSPVVRVPYFDYLNVPRVTILQSCNGLLLCSSGFLVIDDDRGFRYFVCNPTTKQFTVVNLPDREVRDRWITLNLAFEPSRSPHYRVILISSGISGDTDDGFSLGGRARIRERRERTKS